jgi:hypothetical protein
MTIKQFQELYFIAQNKEYDFDKSIKMVGVITGQTPEQIETMPMGKFNKVCQRIQKQFYVFDKNLLKGKPKKLVMVNGRFYRINYKVDKKPITAGKYVEVLTFGTSIVENLHKVMASIVTPVTFMGKPYHKEHDEIASDMESVNFEAAYHAAVFFYTQYKVSMQLIQPYLVKELTPMGVEKEAVIQTLSNLQNILDGFTMPKWSLNTRAYLLNRFGN